ncbi:MAG: c-type cytochrome [Chloroflexi bacterium]|nr:c-type cytochrome [Chloroflexota bacterium]
MKKGVFVFFLFAGFLLTACGGKETAAVPETIPAEFAGKTNPFGSESAAAGAEVYKTYCLACHGEKGAGDGPAGVGLNPKPRNLPQLAAAVGDDYLFWRIAKGVPGTSMVGWQGTLNEEKIWQVVTFIRSLK